MQPIFLNRLIKIMSQNKTFKSVFEIEVEYRAKYPNQANQYTERSFRGKISNHLTSNPSTFIRKGVVGGGVMWGLSENRNIMRHLPGEIDPMGVPGTTEDYHLGAED